MRSRRERREEDLCLREEDLWRLEEEEWCLERLRSGEGERERDLERERESTLLERERERERSETGEGERAFLAGAVVIQDSQREGRRRKSWFDRAERSQLTLPFQFTAVRDGDQLHGVILLVDGKLAESLDDVVAF